ncbi:WecB/TagA/CpsF family glycosyltransferase [Rhizohabitans arisaemae]|uniref:WecB/TagA/CpsF family glycosyltransferase n=1 Tax=Rhizohabitans arisaemae TaxID=2720610 RepID=UPI0024B08D1F|nr:WecB/TagA/CpsF family glycosyltransferase [Rhizohabitans arisaemae]
MTTRVEVLGTPVDTVTMGEAVWRCVDAAERGESLTVGAVNAAKIVKMRRDLPLREAVVGCGLIVADGQAVVWAGRMLGLRFPHRVTGIDLLVELLGTAAERGLRVYFLGAKQETLDIMIAQLRERHPTLQIAGSRNGYFTDEQAPQVADEIRRTRPDLLFLGMPSPKKERFCADYGPRTGARVIHGVGGSFDVLAGDVRRAPGWSQRFGLEWFYRMIQEPVRLGPRYLTTNAAFLWMLAVALLRRLFTPRRGRPSSQHH